MEVPEVLVIALHQCLNIALGNDQTSHGESKCYFIVKKSMLVTDVLNYICWRQLEDIARKDPVADNL